MARVAEGLRALSRSRLGLFLRFAVSLGLFAVVVSRLDVRQAAALLLEVRWVWLLAALLVYVTAELISGLRWQILLRAEGSSVSLPTLLKALVVGRFFNQFMFSTIGGDTSRLWSSAQMTGRPMGAGIVLAADRLIGLIALFAVAAVAAVAGSQLGPVLQAWRWAAIAGALGGLGLLFVIRYATALDWLQSRLPGRLSKAVGILRRLRTYPGALRNAFLLSLLLQIVVVFRYLTLARAVGIVLSPLVFALIVPVALLVLAVPITINGLGLREVTFIGLLGLWGINAQSGAAFAWLDLSFGLVIALGGGLLFLVRR